MFGHDRIPQQQRQARLRKRPQSTAVASAAIAAPEGITKAAAGFGTGETLAVLGKPALARGFTQKELAFVNIFWHQVHE